MAQRPDLLFAVDGLDKDNLQDHNEHLPQEIHHRCQMLASVFVSSAPACRISIVMASFSDVNPKDWIDALLQVLHLIFGQHLPDRLLHAVGYFLGVGVLLLSVWGVLYILGRIKSLWEKHFWPIFYSRERRRESELRRRFASHIEVGVRRLNALEQWSDYRYAELEAEVEAEGERKLPRLLGILSGFSSIRRERSLSRALARSEERLVLLEGGPGSGKSVALRHLSELTASRAMTARNADSLIPVYINLKELEVLPGQLITRETIRSFVLDSLNRVNDRDVEQFLDEFFDEGLRRGTWLFLFDSFDEIPEVLSSVETDRAVSSYSTALADFLSGMTKCKGIIASREFRGPSQLGWPRFKVLPLSKKRQAELIQKAALPDKSRDELIGGLQTPTAAISEMTTNPMFLGLLVEHLRGGDEFPSNSHVVFEKYVRGRLERDSARVESRFDTSISEIRRVAEDVAFCMAADPSIGLSPSRAALKKSVVSLRSYDGRDLDRMLDALEYTKLARSDAALNVADSKPFTFAHRRFQEYFATCVVLREPQLVTPLQFLTDGRWREAAVVLCQNQPRETLAPLLAEAEKLVHKMRESIYGGHFGWPAGTLHLLGILQDGLSGRFEELPGDAREDVGAILVGASESGLILDKKWALEVAGSAPQPVLLELIRSAVGSRSQWRREIAYVQVSRLKSIPDDVASWIRFSLFRLAYTGRLWKERSATRAHLASLRDPSKFSSTLNLLTWSMVLDPLLLCLLWLVLSRPGHVGGSGPISGAVLLVGLPLVLLWMLSNVSIRAHDDVQVHMLTLAAIGRLFCFVLIVSVRPHATVLLFLLGYFVSVWAPFAIVSAVFGQFVDPVWWPLQPLMPALQVARNGPRVLGVLFDRLLLIYSVIPAVVMLMIFRIPPIKRLFEWVFSHLRWAGRILFVLYIMLGAVVLVGRLSKVVSDYLRLRNWNSSSDSIGAADLFQSLATYKTDLFKVKFLRTVRNRNRLLSRGDTEDVLVREILSSSWDSAVEDEANRLLEQARAQRKSTPADDGLPNET
jgi:NACHT domain